VRLLLLLLLLSALLLQTLMASSAAISTSSSSRMIRTGSATGDGADLWRVIESAVFDLREGCHG